MQVNANRVCGQSLSRSAPVSARRSWMVIDALRAVFTFRSNTLLLSNHCEDISPFDNLFAKPISASLFEIVLRTVNTWTWNALKADETVDVIDIAPSLVRIMIRRPYETTTDSYFSNTGVTLVRAKKPE